MKVSQQFCNLLLYDFILIELFPSSITKCYPAHRRFFCFGNLVRAEDKRLPVREGGTRFFLYVHLKMKRVCEQAGKVHKVQSSA